MSLFKSIINSIEEINYLRTQLKEDNARESERRIQESKLLSPEFDYLKIRENGKLERGYPIPMVMSFTYDKVAAAAIIKGYEYVEKCLN